MQTVMARHSAAAPGHFSDSNPAAAPGRLTRKERELLEFLSRHAGQVVGRQTLLTGVWGYSTEARTRTLDVHIRRLRKKLGTSCGTIETIFGVGYRLERASAAAVPSRWC